jgi:hypothetical protein
MKQLLILSSDVYPSGLDAYDATKIPVGQAAVMQNGSIVTSVASLKNSNFTILYRRSKDTQFKNFDVDYNSLTIVKSVSQAAKAKKMTVTVPTTVAKETYGFTIVKKGKTFNERINYSYSEYAKADGKEEDVAAALAKVVNANTENTGVKATVAAAVITLENVANEDFNVVSELCTVATTQEFAPAVLDAAYVKDLAQRCIGGKGIQYLAEDGKELYPGYPEAVADGYYAMYTLRFANKRTASSQVSDNVYQLIHVVFPVTAVGGVGTGTKTTSIFEKLIDGGVTAPQTSGTTDKSKTIV